VSPLPPLTVRKSGAVVRGTGIRGVEEGLNERDC
jgi:hypothetical protein